MKVWETKREKEKEKAVERLTGRLVFPQNFSFTQTLKLDRISILLILAYFIFQGQTTPNTLFAREVARLGQEISSLG